MRKLIGLAGLWLVVVSLLLVACSPAPKAATSVPMPTAPMPPGAIAREDVMVSKVSSAGALSSVAAQAMATERMIVRNGDMALVVKAVVVARDEISQLAVRLDGYVVSSWISGEGQEMRGSIQIRVPDEQFDLALAELRQLAVRVESESTNSQDVTEQYTDLQARLKNAEATESQYLALLDKAKDVPDIIQIYDSLSRVRAEIEQIKGQMQYLERTSAMSLLTVRLQPAATASPLVPVGWSILEALKSAIRGLAIFGQWLVTIAIWVLLFIPVWGTILGIFWWRRRHKKA